MEELNGERGAGKRREGKGKGKREGGKARWGENKDFSISQLLFNQFHQNLI